MWGDRWLKEWRNTMWRREREREREEKGMSKEDVEMRWGRGQQRGSSGNCYGDDVSGNWKVVSFVAFVCEMGAIPARRNTRIYYRLIVVYVQLRRIHNHPSQLGVYTISRRGGVPACTRYSSCKLWTWRRWGASFRDFGSFDMSGEQERFQLELIVALPASDRTSIGSILHRASWMNRHHYR